MDTDPNASVRQVAAIAAQLMAGAGSRASRARPPPPPPPGMLTPMIPHAVIEVTADPDHDELVTEQVDATDDSEQEALPTADTETADDQFAPDDATVALAEPTHTPPAPIESVEETEPARSRTDSISDGSVEQWEAAAAELGTDWKLDTRALLAGTSAALPPARTPLPPARTPLPPPPKPPVPTIAPLPRVPAPLPEPVALKVASLPPPRPPSFSAFAPLRAPSLPSVPSSSPFVTARPSIAPPSARVLPVLVPEADVDDEPAAIPISRGAGLSPIWKARLQLAIAGLIGALVTAVVFALSRAGSPDEEVGSSVTQATAVVPRAATAEGPAAPRPAQQPVDQTRTISADDLPTVPPPPDEEPASARTRPTPAAKTRAPIGVAAPAPATATQGTLRISSAPASNVTLDGRPLGMTPKVVKVAPGVHRVAFIGPKGRKAQSVTVAAGDSAVAAVKF